MDARKLDSGDIEVNLDRNEFRCFHQGLNECCGGFGVNDFMSAIGAEEPVVRAMLDQLTAMFRAPIGHEG